MLPRRFSITFRFIDDLRVILRILRKISGNLANEFELKQSKKDFSMGYSQLAFTCSKLAMQTPELCRKSAQTQH